MLLGVTALWSTPCPKKKVGLRFHFGIAPRSHTFAVSRNYGAGVEGGACIHAYVLLHLVCPYGWLVFRGKYAWELQFMRIGVMQIMNGWPENEELGFLN